jgi:lysophospholipase L1-like esterase
MGQASGRHRRMLPFGALALLVAGLLAWSTPGTAHAAEPVSAPVAIQTASATEFVAFGDSLTSGYRNPGPSWPARLDSKRTDLRLVHNAGVAGDTTTDMLARIDKDVYAYAPSLLIIFAGLNDLGQCTPIDAIVNNIKTMVAGALEHGTRRIVLILNSHVVLMNGRNGHGCGSTVQANIDRLDAALLAYGASAGIQTIDLRPVLDTDGHYTPAFLLPDGVHYNSTGAERVTAAIDAQLSAGFNRYLRGAR